MSSTTSRRSTSNNTQSRGKKKNFVDIKGTWTQADPTNNATIVKPDDAIVAGGNSGFNKFLESIGANDATTKVDDKKAESSDDDMILFQPKMKNLRDDEDVAKLLQAGVFQNIDKQRKVEGLDEVTLTPAQVQSDKDIKFKQMQERLKEQREVKE